MGTGNIYRDKGRESRHPPWLVVAVDGYVAACTVGDLRNTCVAAGEETSRYTHAGQEKQRVGSNNTLAYVLRGHRKNTNHVRLVYQGHINAPARATYVALRIVTKTTNTCFRVEVPELSRCFVVQVLPPEYPVIE